MYVSDKLPSELDQVRDATDFKRQGGKNEWEGL